MIHSGPAQLEVKDGFVTIETAERIRQDGVKEQFCAKNGDFYDGLVKSAAALKEALQAWEQNKAKLGSLCDGVHASDVLDCAERDSSELIAAKTTIAQAEQTIKKVQKRAS